jgi:hypothetical protein
MPTEHSSDRQQVFDRPDSAGPGGKSLILAGIGGLCFAAAGFALAISGRVGQLALHGMTTLPTILSIGALTAGWTLLRSPRRVGVGPGGLTIETRRGERCVRWDEVGCGAVESGGTSHRRYLNVTDLDGRSIVKLDESFDRFDDMAALISRHVEAKGDDTAVRILRKKARRQATLAFVLGLFMAFASVFIAWTAHEDQRAARLLRENGQPGEGEIVRRFIAPNGVTKRVEYRVAGAVGRPGTRNVEIEPAYWDRLEGVGSIPVVFVPDEPGISRLARGEVTDDDFVKTPAGSYLLAALGGVLAVFLLSVSPLRWKGWDLAHESKTRKWTLKRHGQVIWTSRGEAEPRPDWLPKDL